MSEQQLSIMNRIGQLLFRRLNDDLEMEEQILLDEWLREQSPRFQAQVTDEEEIGASLRFMYSIDEDSALADIEKKIHAGTIPAAPIMQQTERPVRKLRLLYWAVAAVLVLSIGVPLLLHNRQKSPAIVQSSSSSPRFKNEVGPGGDKAVLELADGSKIILDNASNGELAKQGHTKVIKLDNGQLAYHGAVKSGAEAVTYNTISTPRGGQYQILLPDGSKVWLNAASSLHFPTAFTGSTRNVEVSGEAYFVIARDASKPFHVKVNQLDKDPLDIEVLGTEFNVMAYGDESTANTTLVNGAVKVSLGTQDKVLKPGEQVHVARNASLAMSTDVDVEAVTAWRHGLIQFQDASIESIMRQVARWYDVDVVYEGKVDQLFIGKVPRDVNLTTMLKILESTGWVHFAVDGKRVTVTR